MTNPTPEPNQPNTPLTDTNLVEDRSKLSKMYQHYVDMKDKYPHALLLYRVGDFFETFFQDAVTVSRELELVLTSKHGGDVGRVAMTGVPHHAWERYTT
ncbi:MAG: DNA mismatch repair protein MutS, partial [Dolichospermum sp.]